MDASVLTWALLGALAGFAASLLPGLHVNALALAWLAWAPTSGLGSNGVAFLVAAFVASPFGLALPSTFLGASSEESALVSLPAHALARDGRGVEAVARQAWGAAMGILVAVAVVPLARPVLTLATPFLARALPWLILAIVILLVVTEPRRLPVHLRAVALPHGVPGGRRIAGELRRTGTRVRVGWRRVLDPLEVLADFEPGRRVSVRIERAFHHGPLSRAAGRVAAVVALALSGLLGSLALPLGATSPFGLPASSLLPLLAGLFAGPVLWDGLRANERTGPLAWGRTKVVRLRRLLSLAGPGALASSLLGIVPGVSASHAALLTPRRDTPEDALVTLGAVNGGAVVFTLLAWHTLDKARSGVLVAAGALTPTPSWRVPVPPHAIFEEGAVVLVAVAAGLLLARGLSMPLARWVGRHPPSRFAWLGVAVLTTMVFVSTGALGLFELAVATLCGRLIARLGVRRGLAMGVILIPALLRAWPV